MVIRKTTHIRAYVLIRTEKQSETLTVFVDIILVSHTRAHTYTKIYRTRDDLISLTVL